MTWRYVGASVIGSQHEREQLPCQDAHQIHYGYIDERPMLLAITADGAGSALHGDIGAKFVCVCLRKQILRLLRRGAESLEELDGCQIKVWLKNLRQGLEQEANAQHATLRAFASTLTCVIVGIEKVVCFQIGDGAIIVRNPEGELETVFWPDNGEYANVTHFVTDPDAEAALNFTVLPYIPQAIALLSDGVTYLALHFPSQQVHTPFFAPMFARLAQEPEGRSHELQAELEQFLASPPVNQRTGDDKTIILAVQAK